jgi:hypothetical protein
MENTMTRLLEFLPETDNLNELELAHVVNLQTLRNVFRQLSVDGKRWWIASDPHEAIEDGYITVGHSDPTCVDRLNDVSYFLPVLTKKVPRAGTDRIVVLIDSSYVVPDQPGFYAEEEGIVEDIFNDFQCFFNPLKMELIQKMLRDKLVA